MRTESIPFTKHIPFMHSIKLTHMTKSMEDCKNGIREL